MSASQAASPTPAEPKPITVHIIDLSADSDDNVVEQIGPFRTVADANLFARRYVRDSVERCRALGMDAKAVLDAWFAYGEDAQVPDAGDNAWRSGTELADFSARKARALDRDWRALDPRLAPASGLDETDLDETGLHADPDPDDEPA